MQVRYIPHIVKTFPSRGSFPMSRNWPGIDVASCRGRGEIYARLFSANRFLSAVPHIMMMWWWWSSMGGTACPPACLPSDILEIAALCAGQLLNPTFRQMRTLCLQPITAHLAALCCRWRNSDVDEDGDIHYLFFGSVPTGLDCMAETRRALGIDRVVHRWMNVQPGLLCVLPHRLR